MATESIDGQVESLTEEARKEIKSLVSFMEGFKQGLEERINTPEKLDALNFAIEEFINNIKNI